MRRNHIDSHVGRGIRVSQLVRRNLLSQLDGSDECDLISLLKYLTTAHGIAQQELKAAVNSLSRRSKQEKPSQQMAQAIRQFAESLVHRLSDWARPAAAAVYKAWRDELVNLIEPAHRGSADLKPDVLWFDFLKLSAGHSASEPTSRFLRVADQTVDRIGRTEAISRGCQAIDDFMTATDIDPRRQSGWDNRIHRSPDALRGVVWAISGLLKDAQWCRKLADLTMSSLCVIGFGELRSLKLANACIRSLASIGTTDAVTQTRVA